LLLRLLAGVAIILCYSFSASTDHHCLFITMSSHRWTRASNNELSLSGKTLNKNGGSLFFCAACGYHALDDPGL
jgi:hypothetical protein